MASICIGGPNSAGVDTAGGFPGSPLLHSSGLSLATFNNKNKDAKAVMMGGAAISIPASLPLFGVRFASVLRRLL